MKKGFHETTPEAEESFDRTPAEVCPRHAAILEGIFTAARCYRDGCGHLFDPGLSPNDVLCPCCA